MTLSLGVVALVLASLPKPGAVAPFSPTAGEAGGGMAVDNGDLPLRYDPKTLGGACGAGTDWKRGGFRA